ncbi:hypothetical protein BU26DRAFT_513550 [Trematosphaeria pertusa]|uniref:Uncharacterized protein n=1 Tax=Trematosphaeria pertusa TaxID=390896 RepID=A0A6A6J1V1_9PLEO|nr:uncharacterized protein BU26DRAFT_513550 [Trematosphaeria pertusa]KAF2256774.1 hypothetical protein BU26DRAFT_513550 [Trematosphaeria pertusa]
MAPPILLSTTRNSYASLRGIDAVIFNKLCNRRLGGASKDCKPSSIKHDTTRALQFLNIDAPPF